MTLPDNKNFPQVFDGIIDKELEYIKTELNKEDNSLIYVRTLIDKRLNIIKNIVLELLETHCVCPNCLDKLIVYNRNIFTGDNPATVTVCHCSNCGFQKEN
jgi:hypothetical protein